MFLNLSQIGQIALAVGDVDRAEAFYGEKLGLGNSTASAI
jgi:catechol 2,3-dioxygenase-like lactoylglutathione lyase family enzyme